MLERLLLAVVQIRMKRAEQAQDTEPHKQRRRVGHLRRCGVNRGVPALLLQPVGKPGLYLLDHLIDQALL